MFERHSTGARIASVAVVMVTAIGLGGCATRAGPDPYHSYYGTPAAVGYDYYYYPSQQVYLEISSGYYWLRDHDRWQRVRHLPSRLRLHEHERVFVRLDSDRPHGRVSGHRDHSHDRDRRGQEHRSEHEGPGRRDAPRDNRGDNRGDRSGGDRVHGDRGRAQDRSYPTSHRSASPRSASGQGDTGREPQHAGPTRAAVRPRETARGTQHPAPSHRHRDAADRTAPAGQGSGGQAAAPAEGGGRTAGAKHRDGRGAPTRGEAARGHADTGETARRVRADAGRRDGRPGAATRPAARGTERRGDPVRGDRGRGPR
jgi:hypothetical protein